MRIHNGVQGIDSQTTPAVRQHNHAALQQQPQMGRHALEQVRVHLHEWPQFCSHLIQILHLKQSLSQSVLEIEQPMQRAKAVADKNGTAATPLTTADSKVLWYDVSTRSWCSRALRLECSSPSLSYEVKFLECVK